MIKIVKPGKDISKTVYVGICAKCGCAIEANEEDLVRNIFASYVDCPNENCGNKILMKEQSYWEELNGRKWEDATK